MRGLLQLEQALSEQAVQGRVPQPHATQRLPLTKGLPTHIPRSYTSNLACYAANCSFGREQRNLTTPVLKRKETAKPHPGHRRTPTNRLP